jgi:exopolysaccharide biosynthesis polyprenyl glycosylphosphotransferase
MLRRFSGPVLAAQFLGDLLLTVLCVKLAEFLRLHIDLSIERREQFVSIEPGVYLLIVCIWVLFCLLLGVYDSRKRSTMWSDLATLWVAITISMLALASLFYFLAIVPPAAPSRLFYGYLYLLSIIVLSANHVALYGVLSTLRRRGRHTRRALLIGGGVSGRHVAVRLRGQEGAGIRLVGYLAREGDEPLPDLTCLGGLTNLDAVVCSQQVDEVVVALPADAHAEALMVVTSLRETGVNVRILPDVFEVVAMKAGIEDFYGLPLISIREPSINPIQSRIKRIFDLVAAGIMLVLLSPVMAVTALWIRLDSPGPIIIHQRRVGKAGHIFHMHKFRSMTWNPDTLDAAGAKVPNDPRVTAAGRVLRRSSIDELPQLWNVVKGEMSIVGPRPELPAIVEGYKPWQMKRFAVPPGMTGWWQVNGRSERSMHQNTEIDLYYVQNYSILLDLQILARTVGAVIRGKGAY